MPDQSSNQFKKIAFRRVPIKLKQFARLLSELSSLDIDPVRVMAMESQLRRTREICEEYGIDSTATLLGRIQSQLTLDDEALNSQKPLIRRFVSRLEHHADRLQDGDIESLNQKPAVPQTTENNSLSTETVAKHDVRPSELLVPETPNEPVDEPTVEVAVSQPPNELSEITLDSLSIQEPVTLELTASEQAESDPISSEDIAVETVSSDQLISMVVPSEDEVPLDSDEQEPTEIGTPDIAAIDLADQNFDPGFNEADFPAPPERSQTLEPTLDTEALADELNSTAAELDLSVPVAEQQDTELSQESLIEATDLDDPEFVLPDIDTPRAKQTEAKPAAVTTPQMAETHDIPAYDFKESAPEISSIRGSQILQQTSELTIFWCIGSHIDVSVKQHLNGFGYHIEDTSIEDAIERSAGNSQQVVIAKLEDFPDEVTEPINKTSHLVLFSEHDTLQNRLKGIRLGATLFFAEPIDNVKLMEYLDTFETGTNASDFHVLVMEDSKAQAKYNDKVLSGAGFETCIVIDPMELLNSLSTFEPEVILMDMQMPGCNGIELTKVLRQIEKYSTVPIVFLSAEENHEKQKEALTSGGNAFVSKPVKKEQLLFMAELYARRTRSLRPHLIHDFVTGLHSASMLQEQLTIEAERAIRQNDTMFLALLEINDLSSLNSKHGYAFGDRCTQQLARLLRQRLRKTDCIGYFDSQRIGVILSHCSDQDAESVMSYLRQTFTNTPIAFENQQIPVGLSIGLAKLGTDYNVPKLVKRAEAAISEAKKHAGKHLIWAHER